MSYVSEVLADNPGGYWRLGETAGTNFNDEANNNDGTSVNNPTLNQTGAISDGNPAVRFVRASTTEIAVNDNATLDFGDQFSLEAWVKMTAVGAGTDRAIVSKSQGAYYMRISAADRIQLIRSKVSLTCTSTVALADTNYHHVVCTKNGAAVKIYIDSVDVTGAVTNDTYTDNGLHLHIAADATILEVTDEFSNDTIDEVAVYPTVLSGARVLAHYNAAFAPANLVAPVASGSPVIGQSLSVTDGTWGGTPAPTFTYQWQRDNLGGGIYGDIGGAIANTYTLVVADLACNVRCVVTGTNASGSEDANSNSLGPVTAAPVGVNRRRQGLVVLVNPESDIIVR